jgi:hypothetical protein
MAVATNATTPSTQFGRYAATRSPGSTPRARSRPATAADWVRSAAYVIESRSPFSARRITAS